MIVVGRAHLANTQEMLTEKASMIMALYDVTSSLNPPLQPRQPCAAQQVGSGGRKAGTFGEVYNGPEESGWVPHIRRKRDSQRRIEHKPEPLQVYLRSEHTQTLSASRPDSRQAMLKHWQPTSARIA